MVASIDSLDTDASKPPKSKIIVVYVTNLPRDMEADEFLQWPSKWGVIEEDDESERKIKIYTYEDVPPNRDDEDQGLLYGRKCYSNANGTLPIHERRVVLL